MTIANGQRLPDGTFMVLDDEGAPRALTSAEVFDGRRVVVFAVPGAFTRTCSSQHLPGFVANADTMRARGVDEVACLSVNDAFVMNAWAEAHGATGRVLMLADGTGAFTRALGMEADFDAAGLGRRSRRYAMVVSDGVVEQVFIEPEKGCTVSAAESVLEML